MVAVNLEHHRKKPHSNQPEQFVAEDIETGKLTIYRIVSNPDDADLRKKRIYIKAPIVQAWLHQKGRCKKD